MSPVPLNLNCHLEFHGDLKKFDVEVENSKTINSRLQFVGRKNDLLSFKIKAFDYKPILVKSNFNDFFFFF